MNQSCWINIHKCTNVRHTTFVWGVGIIASILWDKHTQTCKCGTHYICMRCGNYYYIHGSDWSCFHNGMCKWTLMPICVMMEWNTYKHSPLCRGISKCACKSCVVLICTHLMIKTSVITVYINGFYTNNSHTWHKLGVSCIWAFLLPKYQQTFIAYKDKGYKHK